LDADDRQRDPVRARRSRRGVDAVGAARRAARGLPRRKAITWAALQWIEFPLFLWLYLRIRPKRKRGQVPT
jgi:hypothetical protein